MDQDPYRRLGVAATASAEDITLAYRRLAQRWHPDRNPNDPGAAANFLEIQAAYALLRDPGQRSAWDRRQTHAAAGDFRKTSPRWADHLRPQWSPQPRPRPPGLPGDHAQVQVKVPLASAFQAQVLRVRYRVSQPCQRCLGRTPICPVCGGTGQRFITRELDVHIPAGAHEGQVFRVKGQGHDGPRFSAPGDLWVGLRWSKSGKWRWRNGRLEARYRRSRTLAKKGGLMKVRSPEGTWGQVSIPPLPSGSWIRLPGLGLPGPQGRREAAWIELR